jgi:hypothetical protein
MHLIPNNNEGQTIRNNLDNVKNELSHLYQHRTVLERLIVLVKRKFESAIVIPKITKNLGSIGKDDLSIDLIPVDNLSEVQLRARYEFFQYSNELADVITNIDSLKNLYQKYTEHLKQYYEKQATKITDEMLIDKLRKVQDLKSKGILDEKEVPMVEGTIEEWPKRLAGDKQMRYELYEALQNIIIQHPDNIPGGSTSA